MISTYRDYADGQQFDADVVVIGTGAGGATAGAELAEAGFDVAFIEEGGYHPTASFSPFIFESGARLYRNAGASFMLGVPPIAFAEGRCVGGSTVINGGMTYRAPTTVLERWQRALGIKELGPEALEPIFQRVEARLNASHQIAASIGEDSRIMEGGAKKMGWRYSINKRAQDHCVGANTCVFGCPSGGKQSTLVSYMPRAFRHGARCFTQVRATELLIEGGRCVGVRGRAINPRTVRGDKTISVRARAVVVAAGATETPALLLRYKLARRSGQLGRNFYCHPNVKVLAVYPQEVNAWQGVNQYGQIREFQDDGIIMAENFVPPSVMSAHLHCHGANAWEVMRNYSRMVLSGVLVEDTNSGVVGRDMFGSPVVRYQLAARDHERFLRGVRLLSEMHFAMGAEKVFLPFSNFHEAHRVDELKRIEPTYTTRATLELFTPHLMGTCRMGSSADDSVVDVNGQLWDLPGCYVADASVFPSPIGVNPQVTIMALATMVAFRLADAGLQPKATAC